MLQHAFFGQIGIAPIHAVKRPNVQYADNIVRILAADRHVVMPGIARGLLPDFQCILHIQSHHLFAVRAEFFDRNVIKVQHILDHLVLIRFDDALFTADGCHHADLFLGYGFILFRADT